MNLRNKSRYLGLYKNNIYILFITNLADRRQTVRVTNVVNS